MSIVPEVSHHHHNYVEQVTIALVREYLYKKNFKTTLKTLHAEPEAFPSISNHRAKLAQILGLETLLKKNKKKNATSNNKDSMLDVVVKAFMKQNTKTARNHQLHKQSQTEAFSNPTTPKKLENKQIQTEPSQVQLQTMMTAPPSPTEELNSSTSVADLSYSTSDFIDPEQVESPPLEEATTSPADTGQKSPRLGRSLSASKSPTREEKDYSEDLNNDQQHHSTQQQDVSSTSSSSSAADPAHQRSSFDNEFVLKRPNPKNISSTSSSSGGAAHHDNNSSSNQANNSSGGAMSLAESLLQSKQNILAHGSLSQAEIHKRNRARRRSLSEDSQRMMNLPKVGRSLVNATSNTSKQQLPPGSPKSQDDNEEEEKESCKMSRDLELCDIENEDLGFGDSFGKSSGGMIHVHKQVHHINKKSQLDLGMWRKLKLVTVGKQGFVQEGWVGQGFSFSADVPFGLVQNKGGPCGVLAVVQALILRNLVFGSKFSKDVPMARNEILCTLENQSEINESHNQSYNSTTSSYSALSSKRSEALICVLVEILWRCAMIEDELHDHSQPCVKICLKGNEPGSEIVEIREFEELQDYVRENCHKFDCIGLVYSAILTRGPDRIQVDMDFPDSPLIGQHGYCSLELINLLLFGKSISNVFDNEVVLDGKTLRGIQSQSDIGFLSLFEHYGSCEVGSFMKNPKYPVWICCSESHFSVFFSPNFDIVSRDKENAIFNSGFDLFYYDGLAKQQNIIRLTICFPQTDHQRHHHDRDSSLLALPSNFGGISSDAVDGVGSDHLVPPLEKCIRTKYKNAKIFWNGTEPLL